MSTLTQPAPGLAVPDPDGGDSGVAAAWPRLVAVCALLMGLVFVQDPGLIATDTKLDLTVDPFGFLARASHLWEPHGFLGQVQNQAYGYFVPMGPFFGLGDLLGLPDWVVQRLWWSLLLCLAFVGVERLATALGIGMPWTRLLAGVLYALSPRMLTVLGPSSVEVLPMAMAPWVVLPLVHGSRGGSPRRAAAWSGLALFAVGGVNAVASAVAAVPAALYLMTRGRGARTWRLAGWWLVSVALATAWWMVPLLLLGQYSPPFLDWIESASVTTSVTSLAASLRGVSQWVAYLTTPAGPDLRAGWQLVTLPAVVFHTMAVTALGMAGLALPRLRERLWLVSGVAVGLALVTMGHVGAVDGGLAEPLRAALDGALAALRNTHKFDVVLRLPLALGVAHTLALAASALDRRRADGVRVVPPVVRASLAALLAVVVLGAAAPMVTGRLAPRGAYEAVPAYWTQAASWLDQHRDDGAALVVPGASFGTFVWGRTRDEPLQPLLSGHWVVRDAVPLTPAGTIRALDAVQRRLVSGTGSPGLSAMLARMGIAYVVVRNDLDPIASRAPRPVVVHEALNDSPGLRRVAAFGPTIGSGSEPDLRIDQDLDSGYPAVEVFAVTDVQPMVSVVPESEVVRVFGGPESLLDLGDRGLPASRPVVLAGDRPEMATGATVVTDGMRRREVNFGAVDHSASFTLSSSDPLRRSTPARDYLPFDDLDTVARWLGLDDVAASSSAGDADAAGAVEPQRQPAAAVDGDPTTAWWSSGTDGAVGQWLELRFSRSVDLSGSQVIVGRDSSGTVPSRVTITTDSGSVTQGVRAGVATALQVSGPSRRLRITLADTASRGPGRSFVITDLEVPGVDAERTLQVPGVGASAFLTVADGASRACVDDAGTWLCAADLERPEEEQTLDRVVLLDPHSAYRLAATVVPRPGEPLDTLLDGAWSGAKVTATSAAVADPAGRPQSVIDADLGTGWVANPTDEAPTLTVTLDEPRRVSGLRVRVGPRLAASVPESVVVESPRGVRQGSLNARGDIRFPPLVASSFTIRFPTTRPVANYDRTTEAWRTLPVGVSELGLVGAEDLLRPPSGDRLVRIGCGAGPEVQIGDVTVQTSLRASLDRLVSGAPIDLRPCGHQRTPTSGGLVRVRLTPRAAWLPRTVDLVGSSDVTSSPESVSPTLLRWGPTSRELELPGRTAPALLVVRENTNAGWVATYGGQPLEPVVVDGWQQGWRVPSGGAGTVTLEYRPDRLYRWGLVGGAAAVLALVLAALLRGRAEAGPVAPGRWPRVLVAILGAASLWLVGGWVGLGVGAAAMACGWAGWERFPRVLGGVVGGLVLVTGVLLARGPWGSVAYAGNDAAPQVLCLAALGVVLGATVGASGRGRSHRHA